MKIPHLLLLILIPALFVINKAEAQTDSSWCNHPLRPGLEKLQEVKTHHPWFKVFRLDHNIYAIDEPYNYEETIGYLIIGKKRALLFDTGMGQDTVSLVVKELTRLPVIVLNSHTHEDHIGGNHEFSNILAMNTGYTRHNAANGYTHRFMQSEVTPAAICLNNLPGFDTSAYSIKPFKVSQYINSGYVIDLVGRKLKVISTPGHTPDAICLYEAATRTLFTGDSFYQGPIFLFAPETNLMTYYHSINVMARYAKNARTINPAHNLPNVKPQMVIDAALLFNQIAAGKAKGSKAGYNTLEFKGKGFSYQIGEKFMEQLATLPK